MKELSVVSCQSNIPRSFRPQALRPLPTINSLTTEYCQLPTANYKAMPGFKELKVWKRAVDLSVSIYRATSELRDFGFRDQITRSGLSIPSNIAEGLERSTPADQIKFLDYAQASCGEVRTQIIVGSKVGFVSLADADHWVAESKELSAMIQGLIRSIRTRTH